ncbi:Holliday junction DNA helicase RuvA [Streptococcus equi subsp. zooepidemicus Sz35]|uniref:Holliday junction branch migration complex subunit RuvA n=1 Tax=Streptococcus equi subsp. zooepidemicus (strain MGCS10565) TaxID=552526 RepID=RUVA_STREM|nr:Holliday junction branch migration protein RuvA [Streptococcus equi]B4U0J5.1 RecName: Full=Holliday junction branch migration complex subunit RuvA [Streptococcus equi subsp. zooepidemicus MGCS10565]ACG63204.1 Holliday junction DNA helicase RuvA [Streptococcus equi subsp. zooepidemicus MGCS10565]KIS17685.1 Holliday junction DNA helicase RuvA [Streptococcus equi subsp. zooepidemicus Sz35]MCD3391904.1 Holliday junction branch migration protein RuvA [Streptococcus equi subsp. zooepidemicus]MCD3
MYDYIKGQLTKITAKYIVVEANGLGYMITVANPYSFTDCVNQQVTIYLHQVIREDAQLLFGFHSEEEKDVFLKLISVSGIGPTTALAIVAVDDNRGLVNAIDNSDITYLMRFPKIGKKTAQQMVLDLAGKFVEAPKEESSKLPKAKHQENEQLDEAIEALLALGYKATELKKIRAFFEGTSETAEQYIKSALKMLMKG